MVASTKRIPPRLRQAPEKSNILAAPPVVGLYDLTPGFRCWAGRDNDEDSRIVKRKTAQEKCAMSARSDACSTVIAEIPSLSRSSKAFSSRSRVSATSTGQNSIYSGSVSWKYLIFMAQIPDQKKHCAPSPHHKGCITRRYRPSIASIGAQRRIRPSFCTNSSSIPFHCFRRQKGSVMQAQCSKKLSLCDSHSKYTSAGGGTADDPISPAVRTRSSNAWPSA